MKTNIELLKYMLQDIRKVTLKGISGLTKEQLFAETIKGEYCIGAYLMHLGEADLGWLRTATGTKQPDELKKRVYYGAWFDVPEDRFAPPVEAPEPGEYIDAIGEARNRVLDFLSGLNDEDLDRTVLVKRKSGETEVSIKWIIYHLLEHEAHTRGQMFMLIRMAGFKKKAENN